MMNDTLIIPARWQSSRFPGKPLALIRGRPMLQLVWERAMQSDLAERVFIATDSRQVADAARDWGAKVVMTSPSAHNGTERCAMAARILGLQRHDIVVNLQGDQPLAEARHINQLYDRMRHLGRGQHHSVYTLVSPRRKALPATQGAVYAVLGHKRQALYFSRSLLPFPHSDVEDDLQRHIGMYAYPAWALEQYVLAGATPAERAEGLEQLRWLEQGWGVECLEALPNVLHPEVNYPSDIGEVEKVLAQGAPL